MVSLRDALAQPERLRRRRGARHEPGARPVRREARRVLALARDLAADPRIDVLSITDNPGGHAMLSPDALGTDLISRGQEVIIHLACKDWNRNALESRGWQLSSAGFHNVLALSGDYPVMGHRGLAAPVFDIDSVGLISLFSDMNAGLPDVAQAGRAAPANRLLPGRSRHEPQAVRARGDASVLQAAQEGAGGRAFRDQPGGLEHPQGRRARPLDPSRRPRPARPRERLPALAHGCARLSPRDHPRHRRDRRAARSRRSTRRQPGQGARLLRRSRVEAPRRRAWPRLRGRLPRRPHAGRDVRRDHRTRRRLRRRRLARVCARDPVPASRASSTSSSAIRRRASRPTS